MRVISYNVNGIRAAIKKGFVEWLQTNPADIICLQETKATKEDVDTTDIEKKSLEAHVELCAERYRMLELKIETVEREVGEVKHMMSDVHGIVRKMGEKRNDQLIAWGIGIIGVLLGIVGWLATHYVKTL